MYRYKNLHAVAFKLTIFYGRKAKLIVQFDKYIQKHTAVKGYFSYLVCDCSTKNSGFWKQSPQPQQALWGCDFSLFYTQKKPNYSVNFLKFITTLYASALQQTAVCICKCMYTCSSLLLYSFKKCLHLFIPTLLPFKSYSWPLGRVVNRSGLGPNWIKTLRLFRTR